MTGGRSPRTAVLGLGNLMHTDDGIGVHAIRRLIEDRLLPPEIEVLDGGTLGLDLLPRIEGVSRLLTIDAVDFDAPSGTQRRFAGEDLARLPAGKSVHLLGFTDLLSALRLLGRAPSEVVLLGVQPESTGWGVELSPAVGAALDSLISAALSELAGWRQSEPSETIFRA